ncbi:MAG: hypothetical protein WBI33_11705, partial [Bacteroidales bacterium]
PIFYSSKYFLKIYCGATIMTCQQRKYLILDVINALKQPAAVAWCRWRTFIRCNKCFEATGDISGLLFLF